MSFLFVDHISHLDATSASGWVDLGDGGVGSAWLIIEAVGQLASWVAMERCNFRSRPVAALVGEARFSNEPAHDRLTLTTRIDRVDSRAVLYSGQACAGDRLVAELSRSVGPLLPMDMFDDPETVRAQSAARRGAAPPMVHERRALPTPPSPQVRDAAPGMRRGTLSVPEQAEFFADHFPRRPVYPATLLSASQLELALPVAAEALAAPAERVWLRRGFDIKVRSFSPPGQQLEVVAELRACVDGVATIAVTADADGKRVASGCMEYAVQP
jgi:3-hydroxymyristoyl/3-hydroxydecanoyl-(acyl carrier protein) dehydratase